MFYRVGIIVGAALTLAAGAQAETKSYSKAVQQSCNKDYKAYCGEYGLESNALHDCMNRNGEKLTKTCVNALVADGHVSQAEVDRRRKAAGR